MPDNRLRVDGARVLADLNTLRGIGAYKTGVHKPTFSEAHMRSLQWLAERLPEAGLPPPNHGLGKLPGTHAQSPSKTLAGAPPPNPKFLGRLRMALLAGSPPQTP